MITGVDLIQEQIRAAQGITLRFKQEDIKINVKLLGFLLSLDIASVIQRYDC